jgi:ferredoxin-NADP reductase
LSRNPGAFALAAFCFATLRNHQALVNSALNDSQVPRSDVAPYGDRFAESDGLVVMTLPVREVVAATPRAHIVRLDLGGRDFPYMAGQAVLLGIPGQANRRAYSLTAAPADASCDGCLEVLVGVDLSGRTIPLAPGTRVDVDGPIGRFTFPVDPSERRFIFIAGGTGIAPLRAMLRQALAMPHRDIRVLYSARTPDEFAYQSELRALAREGRIDLRQTITRDDGSAQWTGGRGRFGHAELQPLAHDPATLCFVCGPPQFVKDTKRLLNEVGMVPERIKVEEW